jgi:hypothetical protein
LREHYSATWSAVRLARGASALLCLASRSDERDSLPLIGRGWPFGKMEIMDQARLKAGGWDARHEEDQ